MSENKGCNGWKNYATWVVNVWLDNDAGAYEYWQEQARTCLEDEDFDRDMARRTLADLLKYEHEGNAPEAVGVYADLLNSALADVDWYEIADHYLSDVEVWAAGSNMPGFMPDDAPHRFLDSDEARDYLADMIESDAEHDGADPDLWQKAADEVRDGKGEVGVTLSGRHYFVSKV